MPDRLKFRLPCYVLIKDHATIIGPLGEPEGTGARFLSVEINGERLFAVFAEQHLAEDFRSRKSGGEKWDILEITDPEDLARILLAHQPTYDRAVLNPRNGEGAAFRLRDLLSVIGADSLPDQSPPSHENN